MVSLGSNGKVTGQDALPGALEHDQALLEEDEEMAEKEEVDTHSNDEDAAKSKPTGKLLVAEETAIGNVSWESCWFRSALD